MEYRQSSQIMLMTILLISGSVVRCDDSVDGGEDHSDTDASAYAKRQSLWFGPRLGRNKRTNYDITMSSSPDNILDILRDSDWALIPVTSGGESGYEKSVAPAPAWVSRLGRTEDDEEAMEASRSPPFAPRLGRRRHIVTQFAPRLGRTFAGNTLQAAAANGQGQH